ncbi:cytosolic endo-beta-N-acetylglucosaminidase isoform X2 [Phlebotomus papatasi]|uniref:cytosolic endo-beta-N-acetylglucosaminidase isoform X2 n=1 Tax=Phlebotomus papatasi TaxID=29031 RepID=UPI00248421FD|nr:cytosolic endo-beta-N-acetylglucosaminidase isoform X2 [Phlebotomus papatasi]
MDTNCVQGVDGVECHPLTSNAELFSFRRNPIKWNELVEPLAPRSRPRKLGDAFGMMSFMDPPQQEYMMEDKRPEVLVCHDLAGNYRADRFVDGAEKWDDYRFYHWAGIDYFCYFSHNYITIPPLQWINAAHRHGVKVLGTFITESGAGEKIMAEVLQSEDNMIRVVDELVFITNHCQFDGWLINIECQVIPEKIPLLKQFVSYLTGEIRRTVGGLVVWYDSVIENGTVLWQNEINFKNSSFFEVCDAILLNYNWNEKNLDDTEGFLSLKYPGRKKNVFVGIDVFGRGQVAQFKTHETLEKIAKRGLSIGLFAIGWTFEAMQNDSVDIFSERGNTECNEAFFRRNNRFYASFWNYLYTSGPCELPFYTSFCVGSGLVRRELGVIVSSSPWFNLRLQQPQMSTPIDHTYIEHHFEDSFDGGSCLRITSVSPRVYRLFCVDFNCTNDILFSFALKRSNKDIDLDIILFIVDATTEKRCRVVLAEDFLYTERVTWPGNCSMKPLIEDNLLHVQHFLNRSNEKHIPVRSDINGWETRFYYLSFDSTVVPHIIDIGVRIRGQPFGGHWINLGAIGIHAGVINNLEYEKIERDQFV